MSIAPQPEPSAAVAKFLSRAPRLLIGGEWVEPKSPHRIPVVDPATGREIAQIADADAEDVDRAVAAARAAFERGPWPEMLPNHREALLWKLSDLIEKHSDELAELESINNGKTNSTRAKYAPPGRAYLRIARCLMRSSRESVLRQRRSGSGRASIPKQRWAR